MFEHSKLCGGGRGRDHRKAVLSFFKFPVKETAEDGSEHDHGDANADPELGVIGACTVHLELGLEAVLEDVSTAGILNAGSLEIEIVVAVRHESTLPFYPRNPHQELLF